jgi:hypothetical protein
MVYVWFAKLTTRLLVMLPLHFPSLVLKFHGGLAAAGRARVDYHGLKLIEGGLDHIRSISRAGSAGQ